MIYSVLTAVILLATSGMVQVVQGATEGEIFICTKIQEEDKPVELILTLGQAKMCMADPSFFCTCNKSSVDVACLIGPDSRGDFFTAAVSKSYATSCDRSDCVCTSHEDYV